MNNAFLLTVLVLFIAIALLILIVYLIGRVHELEIKTANALSPLTLSQARKHTTPKRIFSELSGQQLWDEFVSIADGNGDRYDLLQDQDRFFAITELHIRSLLKAGLRADPETPDLAPSNPLKITTLRGEFDSYLPTSQASRLFEIGRLLGGRVESNGEDRGSLLQEARGIIDMIASQIGANNSLADNILFAFE
jgi:hypothetical protein